MSVNKNKWGKSRKEFEMVGSRGGGERGRMDGTVETGEAMLRAFISGRKL